MVEKWIFHFIPILLCMLWPGSWHFAVIVISPDCVNVWDFNQVICGNPCFQTVHGGILGVLHLVLNIMIPIIIIVTTNITLISRVIYEKLARHQAVTWRRHRRMAFQLWFVSSLYMIGWLPLTLIGFVRFTGYPGFMYEHLSTIYFLLYFVPLLLPIVCLCVFPNAIKSTRDLLQRRINSRVGTIT
ncbi:hypothetical protein I4U23_004765 [Adineta vaga]|nr:hypothetical protein I4U23_004765 [Adineta vaga]